MRFESVGSLKVAAFVIFILAVCVVYYRIVKPLLDSAGADCVRAMGELFYFASMLAVFKFFVFPLLGNTFDSEEPSDYGEDWWLPLTVGVSVFVTLVVWFMYASPPATQKQQEMIVMLV